MSMTLKKPKKKGRGLKKKDKKVLVREREDSEEDGNDLDVNNNDIRDNVVVSLSFLLSVVTLTRLHLVPYRNRNDWNPSQN